MTWFRRLFKRTCCHPRNYMVLHTTGTTENSTEVIWVDLKWLR